MRARFRRLVQRFVGTFGRDGARSDVCCHSVLATSIDAIVVIDARGVIRVANPAVERLFGWRSNELIGQNVSVLMPSPDRQNHDSYLLRYLRSGESRVIGRGRVVTGQHRDGTLIPIELAVSEFDADGERWFTGVLRDVSVRLGIERELAQRVARADALGAALPFSFWEADAAGRQRFTNDRWTVITGQSLEDADGDGWLAVVHPDDRAEVTAARERRRDGVATAEYRIVRPDGSVRWVRTTSAPILTAQRSIAGFAGADVDVTAERRTLESMRQAGNDARAASQAKTDFLAAMSHEIRTPMTAIVGYLELLDDADLSAEARRAHLTTVRRNGEHLLALLNDMLDLAKIEAGKLTLEPTACSPAAIADEVAGLLRVVAEAKGVELHLAWRGPVPSSVQSDPVRLRQVLLNVVGNAVKFTERGAVVITGGLRPPDASGRRLLAFAVRDSGIGMSAEELSRLFAPFAQAEASTARRFGGTGLGLLLSKRLCEALGGTIEVESTHGVGSVFTIVIDPGPVDGIAFITPERAPSLASPRVPEPPPATPQLVGRVLLAEDGPDNQRLLAALLRRAGLEVVLAENGQVAIDCARDAAADGIPFDLVLMDMQMPVLDGYSATRLLRREGLDVPIVALTASAMPSDRRACFEAGCNDFVAKPFDRATLLAAIRRHLDA